MTVTLVTIRGMKRLMATAILMGSCSGEAAPPPTPAAPMPFASADLIAFEAPQGWAREEPSSGMRKAQFKVPDKEKTARDAELAVFRFAPSSIDSNVDRWVAQMEGSSPKRETLEGKCKVTLVELSGTYTGDAGGEPLPNARMLAAIVEASDGHWYFKLIGPADTVGDWREEFVALLKGAQR
jgi:hypothetical protein